MRQERRVPRLRHLDEPCRRQPGRQFASRRDRRDAIVFAGDDQRRDRDRGELVAQVRVAQDAEPRGEGLRIGLAVRVEVGSQRAQRLRRVSRRPRSAAPGNWKSCGGSRRRGPPRSHPARRDSCLPASLRARENTAWSPPAPARPGRRVGSARVPAPPCRPATSPVPPHLAARAVKRHAPGHAASPRLPATRCGRAPAGRRNAGVPRRERSSSHGPHMPPCRAQPCSSTTSGTVAADFDVHRRAHVAAAGVSTPLCAVPAAPPATDRPASKCARPRT